ncbi:hypothetical protein BGZ49_008555 [Haplosporangium sp. Z 27]|nr:hypothetical protein BGZ49_008555 [Haplosporangium sp. Z 27]
MSKLVLAGLGDPSSPLIGIYDIKTDTWQNASQVSSASQAPRDSAGIALDSSTGLLVIIGGYFQKSVFSEIDLLYSPTSNFNNLTWTVITPNQSQLMPLYQPIVVYVPQLQSTLVMGGCSSYSVTSGPSNPEAFTTAYLIKTSIGPFGATAEVTSVTLKGTTLAFPAPRLSPCYVVLPNGDIFMYGGAIFNAGMPDAWVLHTSNFSWTPITINNAPPQGRAGAACQLLTPNEIILATLGLQLNQRALLHHK